MVAGGLVEVVLGVPAEQKPLEVVAEPLSLVRMDRPHYYQRGRGNLSGA